MRISHKEVRKLHRREGVPTDLKGIIATQKKQTNNPDRLKKSVGVDFFKRTVCKNFKSFCKKILVCRRQRRKKPAVLIV